MQAPPIPNLSQPSVQSAAPRRLSGEEALAAVNQLITQNQFDAAVDMLAQMDRQAPNHPVILTQLGVIAYRRGEAAAAEGYFRRANAQDPALGRGWCNIGLALRLTGRDEEAAATLRLAIALSPEAPEARVNLANILREQGEVAAAKGLYQAALACQHDNVEALFNYSQCLTTPEERPTAISVLERVLRLRPTMSEALTRLAILQREAGRYGESRALLHRLLAQSPDDPVALFLMGAAWQAEGKAAEAAYWYGRAVRRDPAMVDGYFNLGTVTKELGMLAEAEACYDRALALRPDYAEVLSNRGNLYKDSGRPEQALACYAQAQSIKDNFVEALFNEGCCRLQYGDLEGGFTAYEKRLDCLLLGLTERKFQQAPWRGEPLAGKTLLLWGEQGVGDEILHAAMLPDIQALGATLALECDPRLAPLFARSFPGLTPLPRISLTETPTIDADFHHPLVSFGRLVRKTKAEIPGRVPYLVPDPARREQLRAAYRGRSRGRPVVGISWNSVAPRLGEPKTIDLAGWGPILSHRDALFVSLQYQPDDDELACAARQFKASILRDDAVDPMASLDDFAAQVAAMDLVITTSSTTAHMAGALGVPAMALLPQGPALLWYWFNDGDRSPFYPTLALLRQSRRGFWREPIDACAARFGAWMRLWDDPAADPAARAAALFTTPSPAAKDVAA